MTKVYTAYGETYSAEVWANILDVRTSTVYKHAGSGEIGTRSFEHWIAGRLNTYRESLLMDDYRDITVAELVDVDCIHNVLWTVRECTDDIENLVRLLARESAAVQLSAEDLVLTRNTRDYLLLLKDRLRTYLDAYYEKKKRAGRDDQ